jgi:hypothetical protein
MNVVEARFGGFCAACEQTIQVGERITPDPLDGGGKTWIHERCPAGRMDLQRPVCQECWTEKSVTGACMCEQVTT